MSANGSAADLIFVNGDVYTVDGARSWAQAVAVKGGRITAVGSEDDIVDVRGSATDVVDLHGGLLLPGFQDAHIHPVGGGMDMLQCDMHELHSLDDYLAAVRSYADAHPEREWILGGGWSMDVFPGGTPTKELLDAIVPDRVVFLPNRDGHSAWVNSRALEVAGITRDTPDPEHGRIERDDRGEPTGTLHEGATDGLDARAPLPSDEERYEGLRKGQEYLHSLGITAWQDAIVGTFGWADNLDTYLRAANDGMLTARVVGALWWDRNRKLQQIDDLLAARERGRAGRFAATSVKIMQDGVCENFTAAVLEPYLGPDGTPTANRGLSFVEPELLKEVVTRLDAEGFQVHFHALAERAVRESLDAVAAARSANGMNDLRHHLAHLQIIHPADIPRFRELGAVANAQPLWAAHEDQMDELTIPFLGEERAGWQYPFASLVRAGAVLAMGSDWAVSTPDPIEEIHVAVNRKAAPQYLYGNDNADVFIPQERLDIPTSIAAFTMGSAYVNHLERVTGSIEPGKFADLTVLDRNLFAHPADEIAGASVMQTFVEGERVFAAARA